MTIHKSQEKLPIIIHNILGCMLGLLLVSVFFGASYAISPEQLGQASAYVTNNGLGLADKLMQINQRETRMTKRQLLSNFCITVLEHGAMNVILADSKTMSYDPGQSLFMSLVCQGISDEEFFLEGLHEKEESYVNDEFRTLKGLNLICETRSGDDIGQVRQPVGCIPGCETLSMNQCDFSQLMPKVLRQINNDITNMGLGIAYGITQVSEKTLSDTNKLANQFGVRYFTTILCNREGGSCLYPQTHKRLTTYLNNAKKYLTQTKIINSDMLLQNAQACTNPALPDDKRSCAFAGNTLVLGPVADLLYNELFFYELLMAYYSSYLTSNPYLGDFDVTTDRTKNLRQAAEEIERINQESAMHIQAVSTAIRMLSQTYAYFPMHIALNAYYEGAVQFRNTLARAYQPLHQLHYKLQNVQVSR